MLTRSKHLSLLFILALGGCAADHLSNAPTTLDDTGEPIDPAEGEPSEHDVADDDTASDSKSAPADEPTKPEPVPVPDPEPIPEPVSGHAVWRDTSARIEVVTRNYWLGGMQYERAVEDLDDDQLALLRSLETVPSDPTDCIYDNLEATVTVHDADGSAESFELEYGVCHYDGPLLSAATLKPFLHTTGCLSRGAYGWSQGTQYVAAGDTPVIAANDGCTHGMDGTPPAILLDVTDSSRTYTLESVDCWRGPVQIELYDEAQQTRLAQSAPAQGGCSMLSYQFAGTGRYAVRLQSEGKFSLRVSAE